MKKKWKLIYKGEIDNFDNSSIDYWKNKSADEKFAEVENLIDQAMQIKNKDRKNERELLRTTAVIKRA